VIETKEAFDARRLGKVGASRVADIIAKGKGGEPSASRRNYMAELLCERLTGVRAEGFTTTSIQWGIDHEDEARDAYELETGRIVTQCAGFPHPTIIGAGASPDGLILDEAGGIVRLVEIKCPNTATHLDFLDSGKIPAQYKYQMLWQYVCVRRDFVGPKWVDFVSFDPRLPDKLAIRIARYVPDDLAIVECEREVSIFVSELDALEARMRERMK